MAMPKTQDETSLLKNLVPLNTLSDQQLAQLVSQVSIEQAKKGTYLFRQGDTDSQNFYLLSGKVSLISGSREVDLVKSGSNTARFPLAHKLPREYSVQAKSAVSFVCIDNREISALLAQSASDAYEVNEINSGGSSDWMTQILQSPVFQQIPAANIQGVMRLMEEIPVSRGDIIIRQGDEGDYYYLISQGQSSVSREQNEVMEEIARLGPGESFGEDALISDRPRSSTITMLTDGRLVRLSKQHFVDLVKRPLSHSLGYEQAAARVEKGAVWLDVRTAESYEAAHLRDSINLPLNSLRFQAESLAPDRDYLVYSDLAEESSVAAFLLTQRGFSISMVDVDLASLPADVLSSGKKRKGETGTIVGFASDETDLTQSREAAELTEQLTGRTREAERLAKELKDSQVQHHEILRQRVNELKRLKQAFEQAKGKAEGLEREKAEWLQQQEQLLDDASRLQEANTAAEAKRAETDREYTIARQDLENKLAELTSGKNEEIACLQAEVAQRNATLAAERAAIVDIENQLREAEAQLQNQREEASRAQAELNAEKDEIHACLNKSEAERDKETQELRARNEQLTQERDLVSRQLADLQDEAERFENTAAAQQSLVNQLEKDLSQAKQQQQEAVAGFEAELEAANRRQADLEQRAQSVEAEKAQQAEQIKHLETKNDSFNNKLDQARIDQQNYEQTTTCRLAELEQALDLSQQEVESIRQAHAATSTQLEETVHSHDQSRDESERLRTEKAALETQINSLTAQIKELSASGQEDTEANAAERSRQEQRMAELRQSLDAECAAKQAAEQDKENLQTQIEVAAKALIETEERRQALAAENSAKELERQKQQQRLEQLQFELDAISQTKTQGEAEYAQQLVQAQQRERDLEAARTELETALAKQAESSADALKKTQETLEVRITELERTLQLAEEEKQLHVQASEDVRASLQHELEVSRTELTRALAAVAESAQGELKVEALAQERERLEQELAKAHKDAANKADVLLSQLEQQEKELQIKTAESEKILASQKIAEDRISNLESENSRVTEKQNDLAQLISTLQQENDKLVDSLTQEEKIRDQLVKSQETAHAELESLRRIDRSKTEESNEIVSRLEETEAQLAATEVVREELELAKQQLQSVTDELEAFQQAQDRLQLELSQVEAERDGLLEQVVHSQETLPATDSKVLRERLTEARRQARDSEREKDAARQETDRLKQEVAELRSVVKEYVEQIEAVEIGRDEAESLRAELDLVRQQASNDLDRLKQELQHAQNAASKDGKFVDKEIVERQLQELRGSLAEKIQVHENAEQERAALITNLQGKTEQLSQAQREAQRVQDQLEEERSLHKEQITLRKQLEDALFLLQSQMKTQANRSTDSRTRLIDPENIREPQASRSIWSGLVLGSLLMFGIVEGALLFSGQSELLSSFIGDKGAISIPIIEMEQSSEPAALQAISPSPTTAPIQKAVEPISSNTARSTSTTGLVESPAAKTGPVVIRDRFSDGRYGPAMVKIRGDRFSMGSLRNTLAASEQPAHEVTVRDFLMGQYEVTFNDYDQFAEATGRPLPDDMGWGRGTRPVINVSWEDASAYAQWLSEQTGRQYRLPSEAEWEYAAAAGTTSTYWWGYQPSSGYAICFNCGTQWDNRQTAPAGSLSENPFGLHDTAGNVMEWVRDCRNDNYEFAPNDGSAWLSGDCNQRMARGGAFSKSADRLRTTARAHFEVQANFDMLGFRLARD